MWEFFHIRFWDLDLFPSYGSVSAKKWHWPLLERTTCNMILLLKNNNSRYAGHWCSWDIGQKLPLLCHSFSSVLCVYTVLIDSRYTKLIWYELKIIKKNFCSEFKTRVGAIAVEFNWKGNIVYKQNRWNKGRCWCFLMAHCLC